MTDCKNCPYTDEYCASGDCERNADVSKTLTEKWKKGELNRNKIYYYETPFNTADTASGYWLCNHCDNEKDKIEILGEVPSYEEWKELIESEAKSHLQADSYYNKILDLKALLKECSIANTALIGIMDWLRKSTIPEQRESCEKLFDNTQILQKQLDEVLK